MFVPSRYSWNKRRTVCLQHHSIPTRCFAILHAAAPVPLKRPTSAPHGQIFRLLAACVALLCLLQSCSDAGGSENLPASYIRVDIDKSEPKRLLGYYFGGYVTPAPDDPFAAGIVADTLDRLFINIDSLAAHFPGAAAVLTDNNGDNRIDWDELEAFIDATYRKARGLPLTLDTLLQDAGFAPGDPDWMTVEVNGVMSTARRELFVAESAIRQALAAYWENEERIIYPLGTTIIGRHLIGDTLAETTIMRKREDGFWDFAVYDARDSLAPATVTPPRELKSPVQCVGCHFGSKLFEPEKSFPAKAEPGPHGPRQLYVDDALRDGEIVKLFDEHRRRSDTILGLYTTLFIAQLREQQRSGLIKENDAALLQSLGL